MKKTHPEHKYSVTFVSKVGTITPHAFCSAKFICPAKLSQIALPALTAMDKNRLSIENKQISDLL